jgi:hypothetical protein
VDKNTHSPNGDLNKWDIDFIEPPNLHRAPSVGSLIPKLLAINEFLTTGECIQIVRQCIHKRGSEAGDFASAEIIDEEQAIRLAKESLKK